MLGREKGLAEVALCKGNDKGKQGTRCSVTVVVTSRCFQTNPANVRAKPKKWRMVETCDEFYQLTCVRSAVFKDTIVTSDHHFPDACQSHPSLLPLR